MIVTPQNKRIKIKGSIFRGQALYFGRSNTKRYSAYNFRKMMRGA